MGMSGVRGGHIYGMGLLGVPGIDTGYGGTLCDLPGNGKNPSS